MYVSLCVNMHVSTGAQGDQKRKCYPLELELVRHLMWVLEIEVGSSGRTVSILDC